MLFVAFIDISWYLEILIYQLWGAWDFINGGGLLIQGGHYTYIHIYLYIYIYIYRERERNIIYIYIYIYIYVERDAIYTLYTSTVRERGEVLLRVGPALRDIC